MGGGQGHRKCLVGACGPGQSWQPPQEERTFRGRPKSFHSSLLPPPPLTLSFKGEGRWGWGWGIEACRVSSLLPGTPGRAEQAIALGSQAPSPGQPPHWPASSFLYCPPCSNQPPPQTNLPEQVMEGWGARQGFVCHLATPAWPRALSRKGLGFPDRDQVSQREKEERKTKKRKKRSDLLQLEPS